MSFLVQAQPAAEARSRDAVKIGVLYAAILAIFAVAQLFTFEEFQELFFSFNLALPLGVEAALIPLLIVCEIGALPFLLRMKVSPAFRWLSMIAGWIVPVAWLWIAVATVNAYPAYETVGFLGTVADLTPGWWAVAVSGLLGCMAAWASWGLWPAHKTKK